MKALRIVAVLLALSLMIGEAYRSWGAGRPVAFWMDDMLMGALLIAAAVLVAKETVARRAFFTGAWGVNAGMLYGSFFGKVFDPETTNAGNFDLGVLTILVGLAFATSIIGFAASLMLPVRA
ncbi:MAG: hypothetical protein AB7J28_13180 [Hyphomonadaceae bacterium]